MKNNNEKNIQNEPAKVKKKKTRRIHILDVLIVLLVLAVCVGLFFRQDVVDMFGIFSNLKDAEVTFSVKNVSNETLKYISIDDEVYFKADNTTFGTIMPSDESSNRAYAESFAFETFLINGVHNAEVHYPPNTRMDFKGRIQCRGYFADDGSFMLNGSKYLAAGQSMVICTEKVTLQITITGIKAQ